LNPTEEPSPGASIAAAGPVRVAGRDVRLDALRGFFLILMAGVHFPTPCTDSFHDPLGVVGAADGFVFLSAGLAGRVYGRLDEQYPWPRQRERIWRRVRVIYQAHLLTLLPIALLAGLLARWIPALASHFADLLVHPVGGYLLMPLLLHQPPLFDILPLYILFLAATPLLLTLARRCGWLPLVGASLALWLGVQCHGDAALFADPTRWLPVRWGSFDPFAWQFLWFSGIALGEASHRLNLPHLARRMPGLVVPAAGIVLFGLIKRHGLWPHAWWNNDLYLWMDKWTLGPLRLLDFFAWVLVLIAWNPRVPGSLLAPFALLGRHSLNVFALHIPLAIGLAVWFQMNPPAPIGQSLAALGALGGLYLGAWFWERKAPPLPCPVQGR